MKKRLIQSLLLTMFLLVLIDFSKLGVNEYYEKMVAIYKRDCKYYGNGPRAGVMVGAPVVMVEPDYSVNEVVEVGEPEEIEVEPIKRTWLYTRYKIMGFSDDKFYSDIDLLNRIVVAEAGNQSEYGKRLVIDVVLNRIDSIRWRDDDTIWEVIAHPGQFETYSNGAYTRVDLDESINELIVNELSNRTNVDVVFFRTGHYHEGVPQLFKEGDHYFSADDYD